MTLDEWMTQTQTSQVSLAKMCGVSKSRICQVVKRGTDSLSLAIAMVEASGNAIKIETLVLKD